MLEEYAARIEAALGAYDIVVVHTLHKVQLSPNTGYVEGELVAVDGSRLVFFEFWRRTESGASSGIVREKYRYHFMDAANRMIFRYDNAPHHPQVHTFPHHKHVGEDIHDSPAPSLEEVLDEVEAYVFGLPYS